MGLPGAVSGNVGMNVNVNNGKTEAEARLVEALQAVFDERSALVSASAPKYVYPLSRVTYNVDEIAAVCDALCSTETTMGRRVAEFEQRFAELHGDGGGHAIMVNSGSSADLIAALLLVDPADPLLQPGDEVLAPAVTWPTQIDSLLMVGLSVRLVDINPATLQMDLDDLESKIGPRTRAVSIVHLMGNPCDMDRVRDIAQRHDLVILEDCCEALGAKWNGQMVGTFGLASAYSFFFSHHLTTMEGGMVLVRDEKTADAVRLLRAHGWSRNLRHSAVAQPDDIDPRYTFLTWGLNVRPTEASGAFGLVQMDRFADMQKHRLENAASFARMIEPLAPAISLMQVPVGAECSWFSLPLLLGHESSVGRKELCDHLERAGVETRPVVAGNLARQPMAKLFPQLHTGELPGADRVHRDGLYLGLHPLPDDGSLQLAASILLNSTSK